MERPSIRCTYPKCDCLSKGGECEPAAWEQFYKERDEREARGPHCSFCGMPEGAVLRGEDCGHYEVCSNGGAEMVLTK